MPDQVVLDAMVQRADFAVAATESLPTDQIPTLSVESLSPTSLITSMLRKPDFQRETNHWTPAQVVSFLESFLDNELIPSVILWRSPAHVFVIDGGHRLSALRAWIEDDYGDKSISRNFFSNELSDSQKKIAAKTRKLVEERIGSYRAIKDALLNPDDYTSKQVARARNMAVRSLSLQWVVGDAEKAETSFFKINTQGTPLDPAEEMLLRHRRRSVAIAARSIIRAGTGHKYWSRFPQENVAVVEAHAKRLHELVFRPELIEPIRTLNLPLGGKSSPLAALELLMRLISISNATQGKPKPEISDFPLDEDGSETIAVMKRCLAVLERMTGNSPGSLGLHPAVYFYTEKGRHSADMFLGLAHLLALKLDNNDGAFFRKFSSARSKLEDFLCSHKPLLGTLLQSFSSRQRVEKVSELFQKMIDRVNEGELIGQDWIVEAAAPNVRSKILMVTQGGQGAQFATDTRSAIYLRQSLQAAIKCPICDGHMEPAGSASYDHIQRVREGGGGTADNGQITHPYCNTGMKT